MPESVVAGWSVDDLRDQTKVQEACVCEMLVTLITTQAYICLSQPKGRLMSYTLYMDSFHRDTADSVRERRNNFAFPQRRGCPRYVMI